MANVKMRGVTALLYNATNKIASLSEYQLNVDMATVDVSDHDSAGWGEKLTTFAQWTASAKFWYLGDSTTGVGDATQKALRDALPPATVLTVYFRPNGTATGSAQFTGSCRVSKWTASSPTSGAQNFDVELQGIGALVEGVQ
jgi:predicted secreted protein